MTARLRSRDQRKTSSDIDSPSRHLPGNNKLFHADMDLHSFTLDPAIFLKVFTMDEKGELKSASSCQLELFDGFSLPFCCSSSSTLR